MTARMDFRPVFLLSPIRSYSTVCLALLAGHPDLYGFPEMLLSTAPDVGGLLSEDLRRPRVPQLWLRSRLTGILRAVAELHEASQAADAIERAESWLRERSDWTTIRLMDHLLGLARPRIGLEKSPDTSETDESLDACISAYPRARFIHLTRHPVTSQRSMHEHMRPRWTDNERGLIVDSASAWYKTHLRIARKLASLPEEQWLRVRAEDLLRDSDVWLRKICAWLRLECDDRIVARMLDTKEWRFANAGQQGILGGGDYKFLLSPALRPVPAPGPVIFDPSWGLPEKMIDLMTRLAVFLGY